MQGAFVRAFLALSLCTAAAQGATMWTATLNQAQEVPATGSPGSGTGMASYDQGTTILTVSLTWADLTAPSIAGHIHCCVPPGANGAVAVPFAGLPALAVGSYNNTFNLSAAGSFSPDFLATRGGSVTAARTDLLAGLDSGNAYFNLHTATFPNGEIRGNLTAATTTEVPEPHALPLLLMGLVLVAASRLTFRG